MDITKFLSRLQGVTRNGDDWKLDARFWDIFGRQMPEGIWAK
jgi:hypothetical protein